MFDDVWFYDKSSYSDRVWDAKLRSRLSKWFPKESVGDEKNIEGKIEKEIQQMQLSEISDFEKTLSPRIRAPPKSTYSAPA